MHGRETAGKVRNRVEDFLEKTTPYFLVGTHRKYPQVWLVISIINKDGKNFYAYKRQGS